MKNSTPALDWLRAFEVALSIDGVSEEQATRVANLIAPQPLPRESRMSIRNITWADVNRS